MRSAVVRVSYTGRTAAFQAMVNSAKVMKCCASTTVDNYWLGRVYAEGPAKVCAWSHRSSV